MPDDKPIIKINDRRWMLIASLAGIFVPFGNVIGPLLVKCRSARSEAFRSRLLIIEGIILAAGYVPSLFFMVISFGVSPEGAMAVDTDSITTAVRCLFLIPILIIATSILLWRKAARPS